MPQTLVKVIARCMSKDEVCYGTREAYASIGTHGDERLHQGSYSEEGVWKRVPRTPDTPSANGDDHLKMVHGGSTWPIIRITACAACGACGYPWNRSDIWWVEL
jgi:hypothetical protein